jgi:uncharacterized membrane protein YcaP (DUF421 family)
MRELLLVVGQSLAIYLFLVVALARFGRMAMAGLTPGGYLIIALLGSAVETGLYRGSGSLAAGLASALTVILADHGLCVLMNRWPRVRRWLVGRPVVLVHNGRVLGHHLRMVRLTEDDLAAALRRRGYETPERIRLAVLEIGGAVAVVPMDEESHGPVE